jgi:hypothetical protein
MRNEPVFMTRTAQFSGLSRDEAQGISRMNEWPSGRLAAGIRGSFGNYSIWAVIPSILSLRDRQIGLAQLNKQPRNSAAGLDYFLCANRLGRLNFVTRCLSSDSH